jgi:hypothetical protein
VAKRTGRHCTLCQAPGETGDPRQHHGLVVVRGITAGAHCADYSLLMVADQDAAGDGQHPAIREVGEGPEELRQGFGAGSKVTSPVAHAESPPSFAGRNFRPHQPAAVLHL